MSSKSLVAAVLGTVAVAVAGCSKTQDTAPETRVFGNPPVIESVTFEADSTVTAECDFTEEMNRQVCATFGPDVTLDGNIMIRGSYTEVRMQARVMDPESTPTQSDILLMGASYINVDDLVPEEHTLVMLDDGGAQHFALDQRFNIGLDCTPPMNGACECQKARFDLDANDAVADDQNFTRHFAFVPQSTGSGVGLLLQDCVMKDRRQFPQFAAAGQRFEFSFDAVDKRGNIVTWPQRHTFTIPTVPAIEPTCTGDECFCCAWFSATPEQECRMKPGMVSPDFPNGLCMSFP